MSSFTRPVPCLATVVATCLLIGPVARAAAPSEVLVSDNTDFALDLYQQLCPGGGNLFFSPYSISTALAMTYAGARGETEKQMAKAMRFSLPQERLHPALAEVAASLKAAQDDDQVTLSTANGLWPQAGHDFLPSYLTVVKRHYGVSITPVDYENDADAARARINAWVEEQTRDKIRDLIPSGALSAATRLVLANAIYFKGTWEHQFSGSATRDAPFFVSPQRDVSVRLMQQRREFRYGDFDELQVIVLPYEGGRLSMLILLPKEQDGLEALENRLTSDALRTWAGHLAKTKVLVQLPRFRMEASFELNEALASLGMVDAFNMANADFSGMDGGAGRLYISAVVHKACVEMSEEGTEAAAATGVIMTMGSISTAPHPITFRADHPFLFLIRENATGSVLFLGRVVDPSAAPGSS